MQPWGAHLSNASVNFNHVSIKNFYNYIAHTRLMEYKHLYSPLTISDSYKSLNQPLYSYTHKQKKKKCLYNDDDTATGKQKLLRNTWTKPCLPTIHFLDTPKQSFCAGKESEQATKRERGRKEGTHVCVCARNSGHGSNQILKPWSQVCPGYALTKPLLFRHGKHHGRAPHSCTTPSTMRT